MGLIAAPYEESGPARRLAVTGAAVEILAAQTITHRLGLLSEPYHQGRPVGCSERVRCSPLRESRVRFSAGAAVSSRRCRVRRCSRRHC
jgi:hypothetical protein